MTTDQLGEIKREFKPALENLIAGVILTVLVFGAGIALLCVAIVKRLPVPGALGVGVVIGGFLLVWWLRSLFGLRIKVCERGLSITRKKATRAVAWQEVASVVETHKWMRHRYGRRAEHLGKDVYFTLSMMSGGSFRFGANQIKGHKQLASMIKSETERRGIPWHILEVG